MNRLHETPLAGFEPAEALRRLLAALGRESRPAELTRDPEALLGELERHGFLARWTHPDPAALPSLGLPSLALLDDGTCLLLASRRGGRLIARGPGDDRPLESLPGAVLDLAPALPPQGGLWRCLGEALLPHRGTLLRLIGVALLVQGCALATPQFTRILVDRAFPQGAWSMFAVVLAASAFMGLYQAWVGWLQGRIALFLEVRLGFVVEQGLMARLLRLPYRATRGRTTGDLLQVFSGMRAAKDLLTGSLLGTAVDLAGAAGSLVLMAAMLPGATLLVAALTLVSLALTILVGLEVVRWQTRAVEAQVLERGFLVEVLNGVETIKACAAEPRTQERWMALARRRRRLDVARQRLNVGAMGLLNLAQALCTQALTIWGGHQVFQGRLRLGEMLAFTMMATTFQMAVSQCGDIALRLAQLRPHLAKVRGILETGGEPPPEGEKPLLGPVRIQDLAFRYHPGQPWVLENFDLTVAPGERVVLRGPSGCGKSTLLKLIANFHPPCRGRITLGGASPLEARGTLMYLPQAAQLFHGSVFENLRLFSGGASRGALMDAAGRTGLAELAAGLPMGYETLAGPGGTNFSGGQRQLIALTAVIASGREVLLLDEAMASLDTLSRERLLRGDLFRGKTVLLASHEDVDGPLGPENHGFRKVEIETRDPSRCRRWPWPVPSWP